MVNKNNEKEPKSITSLEYFQQVNKQLRSEVAKLKRIVELQKDIEGAVGMDICEVRLKSEEDEKNFKRISAELRMLLWADVGGLEKQVNNVALDLRGLWKRMHALKESLEEKDGES